MLFWLIYGCAGAWWEFNFGEFDEKVEDMPVFVVLYVKEYPEMAKAFAEMDTMGVYVTAVNCSEVDCRRFGKIEVPQVVVASGVNERYWRRSESMDVNEWSELIREAMSPSLREVRDKEEALKDLSGDGTVFHVETPDAEHNMVAELREASVRFKIYNCTFTFSVNKSLSEPRLVAHTSKVCGKQYANGAVSNFVEDNLFGVKHRYDWQEYQQLERQGRDMLLVLQWEVLGNSTALQDIGDINCDKDLVIGWMATHDNEEAHNHFNVLIDYLPIVIYESPTRNCSATARVQIHEIVSSGFLADAEKGTVCGTQLVVRGRRDIGGITGLRFIAWYFSVLLSLIALIRLVSSHPCTGKLSE